MRKFRPEEEGGTVKPPNFQSSCTPHQAVELWKCSQDPVYFLTNYGKVIHPTKGAIPFKLYDYQKRMLHNYTAYNRVISTVSRQGGKTASAAGFLLWYAMFHKNKTVLVLSRQLEHAKEILDRIKNLYMECPWFLKCGLVIDNVFEMRFDNGSRIISQATTPNSGRGYSISLLYIDELAFIEDSIAKPLWTSVIPTVPPDGKIIITSTPNTDEDKFAQIWLNAIDAPNTYQWNNGIDSEELKKKIVKPTDPIKFENEEAELIYNQLNQKFGKSENSVSEEDGDILGYRRFFAHWTEHPDRDENFKKAKLAEISMSEWLRDYECQFVTQDPTLVESMALNRLNYYTHDPIRVDKHGVMWYRRLEANQVYGVTLDPGEGVEGDNSVIQVWALPQMLQVAEWASNSYDQIDQTKLLVRILRKIDRFQQKQSTHQGESLIYYSVECNGIGMGIINLLLAEEETGEIPGILIDSDGNKSRGIRTTMPSKRDYSLKLKLLLERSVFTPASRYLVSELKTFVKRGKSFAAKSGCKDDRVMSCVLMLHMLDEIVYYEEDLEEVINFKSIADGTFFEADYDDYEPALPIVG